MNFGLSTGRWLAAAQCRCIPGPERNDGLLFTPARSDQFIQNQCSGCQCPEVVSRLCPQWYPAGHRASQSVSHKSSTTGTIKCLPGVAARRAIKQTLAIGQSKYRIDIVSLILPIRTVTCWASSWMARVTVRPSQPATARSHSSKYYLAWAGPSIGSGQWTGGQQGSGNHQPSRLS